MYARDIMTEDVITVTPQTKVRELIRVLHKHDITGVPVIDEHRRLAGIVSEKDVIRAQLTARYEMEEHEDLYDLFSASYTDIGADVSSGSRFHWVEQIMTSKVVSVSLTTPVEQTARIMVDHRYHRLPVVDGEGNLRGIVTTIDLVKLLSDGG